MVSVVSSDIPGLGKTESIKTRAHRDERELCTIVISGSTSRDEIVRSLHSALHAEGAGFGIDALHINILDVPVACAEEVNDILFELLYLSIVFGRTTSAVSLIHVGQPAIFIELANMVKGDDLHDANMANRDLKYRLPLCRYLQEPPDHLTWDVLHLKPIICADISSNMQVALNMLKLLKAGLEGQPGVNERVLKFGEYGSLPDEAAQLQQEAIIIEPEEAIELLNEFFFAKIQEKRQQPSFRLMQSFLAFLAAQLRKFTICSDSFYRPDVLPDVTIRTTIVRGLVSTAVRFAARSRSGEGESAAARTTIFGLLHHYARRGHHSRFVYAPLLPGTLAERIAPQSFDQIDYLLLLIQPGGGLTPFYRKVSAFEQEGEGEARGALANWYKETTDTKLNPDYAAMSEEQLNSSLIHFLGQQSRWFIRSLHIGLRWTDLGATRPGMGQELDCGALRDALAQKLQLGEKLEFTREEFDHLDIDHLDTAHFVRANGKYFGSTGKKLEYALTGDNLLKMRLVHMRITAGLPVVVMGETGCGKTSLLKYLARAAGIYNDNFQVLNIHAGIGKPEIIAFVREAEKQAQRTGSQARAHTVLWPPHSDMLMSNLSHCFRCGRSLTRQTPRRSSE